MDHCVYVLNLILVIINFGIQEIILKFVLSIVVLNITTILQFNKTFNTQQKQFETIKLYKFTCLFIERRQICLCTGYIHFH